MSSDPSAAAPPPETETVADEYHHADDAQEPRPAYYAHVDIEDAIQGFLPLEKAGNVYVARLQRPVWVQTPPLTLASELDDDEGAPMPHAHLVLPTGVTKFARGVEAAILRACIDHKDEWFRRAVDDRALRAGFKEFCKADGHLKIRVPRDALVFDASGQLLPRGQVAPGSSLRCVLELSKVCFGRTEFGAMWTLLQAQTAPPPPPAPRCLIDPQAETEAAEPGDAEADLHEFL